jgi:hypothetical protein
MHTSFNRQTATKVKDGRLQRKRQVRVIGTFNYKDGGSGHLGMCPAEITNLELFEPLE